MKETKHWYLPLDKHEGWLRQWILEEHKEWRPNVYGQCKSWLDMGLQPRAVSRDLDWGIPVPVEGADGEKFCMYGSMLRSAICRIPRNSCPTPRKMVERFRNTPDPLHRKRQHRIPLHCILPAMLKAKEDSRAGQCAEQRIPESGR